MTPYERKMAITNTDFRCELCGNDMPAWQRGVVRICSACRSTPRAQYRILQLREGAER